MRALRDKAWLALGVPLLFWFGPTLLAHARRTFDPYAFNDDARILIWPFFSDSDPALFVGDPFASYFLSGLPEGYRGLYHLFGKLGVAAQASEVLPYLLLLHTLVFIAWSAHRIGGKAGAFLAVTLLLGSFSVIDRLGGGLPRAFAFPLMAMGCYALVCGHARLLAVLSVLGAAFYPVVAALLGLSLFFLLALPAAVRGGSANWSLGRRCFWLLGTLTCIAVLLVPTARRLRQYGATITEKTLVAFPEAGPGGRLGPEQQSPFPPWYVSAGFHAKQGLLGTGELIGGPLARKLRGSERRSGFIVFGLLALGAARLLVRAVRGRSASDGLLRLLSLMGALIVGYTMAAWVTPNLFLPERYAQYSVPLLAILLLSAATGGASCLPRSREGEGSLKPSVRATPGGAVMGQVTAWLSVAGVLLLLGGRGTAWTGIEIWSPPEERAIYTAIAKLPPSSVIAGWPTGPLENIPLLAKRRVLTNYQLEMPFHQGFTEASRQRVKTLFEAYFADQPGPLRALKSSYGVTHLLVEPQYFAPPMPTYYRPYDVEVWRLFRRAQTSHLLLDWAMDPRVSRRVGNAYLVDLTLMLELLGQRSLASTAGERPRHD